MEVLGVVLEGQTTPGLSNCPVCDGVGWNRRCLNGGSSFSPGSSFKSLTTESTGGNRRGSKKLRVTVDKGLEYVS